MSEQSVHYNMLPGCAENFGALKQAERGAETWRKDTAEILSSINGKLDKLSMDMASVAQAQRTTKSEVDELRESQNGLIWKVAIISGLLTGAGWAGISSIIP